MNGNFGVTTSGKLYATGAYIEGNGTFTGTVYASGGSFTGTITASTGKIGNWTIATNELYAGNFNTTDKTGTAMQATGDKAFVAGGWDHTNYGNANFYVTHSGFLYAQNANIAGTVHATAGDIAGLTVGDLKLDTGSGALSVQ